MFLHCCKNVSVEKQSKEKPSNHFCLISFNVKAGTKSTVKDEGTSKQSYTTHHNCKKVAEVLNSVSDGCPCICAIQEITHNLKDISTDKQLLKKQIDPSRQKGSLYSIVEELNKTSEDSEKSICWKYHAGSTLHGTKLSPANNGVSWIYRADVFEHLGSYPLLALCEDMNTSTNGTTKKPINEQTHVKPSDWQTLLSYRNAKGVKKFQPRPSSNRLLYVTPLLGFFRHKTTGEITALLNLHALYGVKVCTRNAEYSRILLAARLLMYGNAHPNKKHPSLPPLIDYVTHFFVLGDMNASEEFGIYERKYFDTYKMLQPTRDTYPNRMYQNHQRKFPQLKRQDDSELMPDWVNVVGSETPTTPAWKGHKRPTYDVCITPEFNQRHYGISAFADDLQRDEDYWRGDSTLRIKKKQTSSNHLTSTKTFLSSKTLPDGTFRNGGISDHLPIKITIARKATTQPKYDIRKLILSEQFQNWVKPLGLNDNGSMFNLNMLATNGQLVNRCLILDHCFPQIKATTKKTLENVHVSLVKYVHANAFNIDQEEECKEQKRQEEKKEKKEKTEKNEKQENQEQLVPIITSTQNWLLCKRHTCTSSSDRSKEEIICDTFEKMLNLLVDYSNIKNDVEGNEEEERSWLEVSIQIDHDSNNKKIWCISCDAEDVCQNILDGFEIATYGRNTLTEWPQMPCEYKITIDEINSATIIQSLIRGWKERRRTCSNSSKYIVSEISCTCPHFIYVCQKKGEKCKHMRACIDGTVTSSPHNTGSITGVSANQQNNDD